MSDQRDWKEKVRRDFRGIISEEQIQETIFYWNRIIHQTRLKALEEAIQIVNIIPLDQSHIPAGQYSAEGMNGLMKVIRRGIIEEIRRSAKEKK